MAVMVHSIRDAPQHDTFMVHIDDTGKILQGSYVHDVHYIRAGTTSGHTIVSCLAFVFHRPSHQLGQVLGRCNPRTLAIEPQRNRQQPKDPHDHTKDAERKCRASRDNPVGDEERPSESNDGAHDGCHDEAVAVYGLVGVDELVSVSG
jgi:hypothetical protein